MIFVICLDCEFASRIRRLPEAESVAGFHAVFNKHHALLCVYREGLIQGHEDFIYQEPEGDNIIES